jgi:FkbM family methyltransferase
MACAHSMWPGERVDKKSNYLMLRKYAYYLYSIFELLLGFENPFLIIKTYLNLTPLGVKIVHLRKPSLNFSVRGAMDIWSIKETFLDRFYEKHGFVIEAGWNVIDIGAGIGDFTLYATIKESNVRVFAFEPYPESFTLMKENLRRNGISNVQAFDQAIGAHTGDLILDLTSGEPLQFQSQVELATNIKNSLSVNSLSLIDALTTLDLDSCDLLKLDCEGAEYSILFNSSPSALERIQRIVMEYHDNLVPHQHAELASFLQERGFQVETFPNPVHSNLGYLRAWRKNPAKPQS